MAENEDFIEEDYYAAEKPNAWGEAQRAAPVEEEELETSDTEVEHRWGEANRTVTTTASDVALESAALGQADRNLMNTNLPGETQLSNVPGLPESADKEIGKVGVEKDNLDTEYTQGPDIPDLDKPARETFGEEGEYEAAPRRAMVDENGELVNAEGEPITLEQFESVMEEMQTQVNESIENGSGSFLDSSGEIEAKCRCGVDFDASVKTPGNSSEWFTPSPSPDHVNAAPEGDHVAVTPETTTEPLERSSNYEPNVRSLEF